MISRPDSLQGDPIHHELIEQERTEISRALGMKCQPDRLLTAPAVTVPRDVVRTGDASGEADVVLADLRVRNIAEAVVQGRPGARRELGVLVYQLLVDGKGQR